MRTILILLILISTVIGVFAQKELPRASLASNPTINFDPTDIEWLRHGGSITLTILVDKKGKARIIDVTGPLAPCAALYHYRIESLQKSVTAAMENAAYEPAKNKDGRPVDGGFTMKIKIPSSVRRSEGQGTDASEGKKIVGGVVNGKAIHLERPEAPSAALPVGVSGAVRVEVLIDEEGNVISAAATNGHILLRSRSVDAACRSRFSPTRLSGEPVKVLGVITYDYSRWPSPWKK